MFELFKRAERARARRCVYVTHDRELAGRAHRIVSIRDGVVVARVRRLTMVSALLRKSITDLSRRRSRTFFAVATLALAVTSIGLFALPSLMNRVDGRRGRVRPAARPDGLHAPARARPGSAGGAGARCRTCARSRRVRSSAAGCTSAPAARSRTSAGFRTSPASRSNVVHVDLGDGAARRARC